MPRIIEIRYDHTFQTNMLEISYLSTGSVQRIRISSIIYLWAQDPCPSNRSIVLIYSGSGSVHQIRIRRPDPIKSTFNNFLFCKYGDLVNVSGSVRQIYVHISPRIRIHPSDSFPGSGFPFIYFNPFFKSPGSVLGILCPPIFHYLMYIPRS